MGERSCPGTVKLTGVLRCLEEWRHGLEHRIQSRLEDRLLVKRTVQICEAGSDTRLRGAPHFPHSHRRVWDMWVAEVVGARSKKDIKAFRAPRPYRQDVVAQQVDLCVIIVNKHGTESRIL